MILDPKTQQYIPNPDVVGGLSLKGIQDFKTDFGKMMKWGATNQKYLEEINKDTVDVETDPDE